MRQSKFQLSRKNKSNFYEFNGSLRWWITDCWRKQNYGLPFQHWQRTKTSKKTTHNRASHDSYIHWWTVFELHSAAVLLTYLLVSLVLCCRRKTHKIYISFEWQGRLCHTKCVFCFVFRNNLVSRYVEFSLQLINP